jgi:hypothetical protein
MKSNIVKKHPFVFFVFIVLAVLLSPLLFPLVGALLSVSLFLSAVLFTIWVFYKLVR